MVVFAGWATILTVAFFNSHQRSTRIFLVCAIALNVAAIATALVMNDLHRFRAFQQMWDR